MTPMQVERTRMLYAMLAGIPAHAVDTSCWRTTDTDDDAALLLDPTAIACPIGWASAYPPFKSEGLHFIDRQVRYHPASAWIAYTDWNAVEQFFGIRTAYDMFGGDDIYDMPARLHKWEVLKQIRKWLYSEGHITRERFKQLRKYEKGLKT